MAGRETSHIERETSDVEWETSHIEREISHIEWETSHIEREISHKGRERATAR